MLRLQDVRQYLETYSQLQPAKIFLASPRLVANRLVHPNLDKPKSDFLDHWQPAIESSNEHGAHMYSQSFQLVYRCDQNQLGRAQQHGDPRPQIVESFCDIDMTNLAHHAYIKQFRQHRLSLYFVGEHQCDVPVRRQHQTQK